MPLPKSVQATGSSTSAPPCLGGFCLGQSLEQTLGKLPPRTKLMTVKQRFMRFYPLTEAEVVADVRENMIGLNEKDINLVVGTAGLDRRLANTLRKVRAICHIYRFSASVKSPDNRILNVEFLTIPTNSGQTHEIIVVQIGRVYKDIPVRRYNEWVGKVLEKFPTAVPTGISKGFPPAVPKRATAESSGDRYKVTYNRAAGWLFSATGDLFLTLIDTQYDVTPGFPAVALMRDLSSELATHPNCRAARRAGPEFSID